MGIFLVKGTAGSSQSQNFISHEIFGMFGWTVVQSFRRAKMKDGNGQNSQKAENW